MSHLHNNRLHHLGLNLVYLIPGETGGTETYARELLPALRRAAPDLRITAFINAEAAASGPAPWTEHADSVELKVHARSRAQWVRAEQQLLPRLARRLGCQIVHSLANTGPVHGSFARVLTVQDVYYRVAPEAHFGARSWGMRLLVPAAAHTARRIFTPSQSTRADLLRYYPRLDPSRVEVVPHAVGPARQDATSEAKLRDQLALADRRVVLSVSAKRPHKNVSGLLRALALLDPRRRPLLVVPGYRTPHEADLRELARELAIEDDVRFPAWLSDRDLEGLYALADAAVVASRYEGFGLPVLDALVRGVPVACSDRSSLPEVAGDAALLFDPDDERAIAEAIGQLLEDASTAERLREAGRRRARLFSWDRSAREHLAGYARALE